jgi:hypothetical protein
LYTRLVSTPSASGTVSNYLVGDASNRENAMNYCAVRVTRGRLWDWSSGPREQAGWEEHARFMDGLVEDGFILLDGRNTR